MKKYIILLYSLLLTAVGFAQQGFTLRIQLSGLKNYQPRLIYEKDGNFITDSVYTTEKGWIIMKGKVKLPVMASLRLEGSPALEILRKDQPLFAPALQFFLTNEVITIMGDADKVYTAQVQGGKENADWKELREKEKQLQHENWIVTRAVADSCIDCNNATLMNIVRKQNRARSKEIQEIEETFYNDHPNSAYSMYILYWKQAVMEPDSLRATFKRMGNAAKNNVYAASIKDRLVKLETTAVGKPAIQFKKKDINGREVSLATLKGKYVLLDFWGSWCHGCRESHPHMKELYKKYKPQGLEIVGVSSEYGKDLDKSRKLWLDAINADGIDWVNVLNNEGVEQFDAVTAYGISAFPTHILLDKEGKIIGRWVG